MVHKRKCISLILIVVLMLNIFNINSLATGSGSNKKVEISDFNRDGFQTFRFYVSSKISSSKYKYKTIGWKVHIAPEGTDEISHGDIPFQFKDKTNDQVNLELIDIFNTAGVPQIYREVGGKIEADAIQVILINGIPMGTNNKPVDPSSITGWENDTSVLLNNSNVKKFSDLYFFDKEKNKLTKAIITGLPNGLKWSDPTQSDLQNAYYDHVENYKPVAEAVPVTLNLEVTSSLDEQTLDMSKGEGQAIVRIHASGKIDPDEEKGQIYAENYNNIRYIAISIGDQEKKLYPGTDFTSLDYATDFTFTYLPNDIEDGDSDMNDEVRKDYSGSSVHVEYKKKYFGDAVAKAETDVIKKAPIPDGDPLAILSAPDQVLVGEEILADGTGSIAPKGATIVNYQWKVETKALPTEEGKKSIKLTYNEPKTITIALTVTDSNGKTDTAMKDVVVKKKASPPTNWSPSVTLTGPNIVMQGDSLTLRISATDKEDGILKPTLSKPSCLTLDSSPRNGENSAKFIQSGIFTVTAKATDSGGKSDSASIQIEVCPPKPLAIISEDGDYKIGQTVILDSSKSKAVSKTYPIDWTLTKWEITPLGSLKQEDVFYKKLNDKEIAFTSKKTGNVEISLTVTNTLGYSNTRTIQRTIVGDTPPKADFSLIKKVYRDKDNDKKAIVRAFDMSSSPDGDSITKRAWFYAFDSDNDGIFSDETWYYNNGNTWVDSKTSYGNIFSFADTVETGNLTDVTVETKHVGRYKFELKVYEEHDNRLLEFVDSSYILTDDTKNKPGTECIAEVDNIAPVTAVKVDVSNNDVYDIVVATDYKDMDLIQLQTQLNLLKAEGFANNKEFKIHMITDKVKTGQQHKIRNYYTYARNIYLSYYLESGRYEFSGPGGNSEENYNHDYRSTTIQYETTQGYTMPTISFQKGDKAEWQRGSFSKSGDGYEESGVEFRFFNPDNKIGTLSTNRITTQGWMQGINFCQTWNNIRVEDENVNITNHWSRTSSFTPHDFYYDIHSMDFSKVKDIPYTNDSKKVFLCFTKGNGYDYENENGYNYSVTSLTKDFMDYLIYNDFETYVIAQNKEMLDIQFNNNNYSTDVNNQYASLRELAHCSPVRGKYVIGNANTDIWQDQLTHITKKNVVMPNKVTVENNVVTYEFDENFKEGEELDLTLLQQELKISDLVGNKLELPKITYKVKNEDNGIKQLSSLCFTNPTLQTQLKEDIEIIKVTDEVTIYKDNEKIKIAITDKEKAKDKFGDNIMELNSFDYTNVKDICTLNNLIVILYDNGTVKAYGSYVTNHYSAYKIDESKWTSIDRLFSTRQVVIGLKRNGSIILLGGYQGSYSGNYYDNVETQNNNHYYDGVALQSSVVMLYRNEEGNIRYSSYGSSYIRFYPDEIKKKFHTDNYKLVGNSLSNQLIVKIYNNYYRSDDYSFTSPIEELGGINNVKKLIPINYNDFIVVKQDDTLYFSESLRNRYESMSYYPGLMSKLNNLGKFKNITFIDSDAWITGTNDEAFIGSSNRNSCKTLITRYIPIDDIKKIIPGGGYGYGYDEMIIIMKNGKRCYSSGYIHSMFVPSSAKYYFVDDKGVSYMNDNGYFYSSIVPYYTQNGWTEYNYRKFNRKFDKVVNCGLHIGLIGILDGRASVYRKDNEDYYRLDSVKYYRDIVDIIPNGSQQPWVFKKDTNIFRDRNISKYIVGNYNNGKYSGIFGLDAEGNVCYNTEKNELIIIETNVEDIFKLEGEIICLKRDGTLSKYGESKHFEKYDGMFITPKFITLKLKDRNEKVCISKNGVQVGYIGGFNNKIEFKQFLSSTQIHLGKHLNNGISFKYKIFTDDEDSIEEILYNQELDSTWLEVKDKDIISVEDGYYIGVIEVDSLNRAVRYSYMKAIAENL
ncbi:hypothetical protein AN1V17_15230 [Vallitalea sediminicola]